MTKKSYKKLILKARKLIFTIVIFGFVSASNCGKCRAKSRRVDIEKYCRRDFGKKILLWCQLCWFAWWKLSLQLQVFEAKVERVNSDDKVFSLCLVFDRHIYQIDLCVCVSTVGMSMWVYTSPHSYPFRIIAADGILSRIHIGDAS